MRTIVEAARQATMKVLLIALVPAGLLAGCYYRAWYDGFRQSAQRECLKNREDCADTATYEEYKRERDEQLETD